MKNLSSFGVQELNAKEMENINGGGWFVGLIILAAGFIVRSIAKNKGRIRGYVNGHRVY